MGVNVNQIARRVNATGNAYDFCALSFYGCCFRECYAVERHFRG
ncbi:plasmid mobilization relaxosome protein MobC [Roseburia sp. 1XD42-69]|nr:plasmid mobilization relaxosome protein MobC [Roseburia sp. 1XD42-69]